MVNFIIEHMIAYRETFLEKPLVFLEELRQKQPEVVEALMDDSYSRKQVAAVPDLVRRTLELSQLETARVPSDQTRTYLREATRTYLHGMLQSSIALCRAALEQGLKERLSKQSKDRCRNLYDLIEEARRKGLLDDATKDWAHYIRDQGRNVLHRELADDGEALTALDHVRGVLTYIYRDEDAART